MIEKYPLLNEPGKTMIIFSKNGKYYGHIIKDRTDKAPSKFLFETPMYASIDAIKADYPPQLNEE